MTTLFCHNKPVDDRVWTALAPSSPATSHHSSSAPRTTTKNPIPRPLAYGLVEPPLPVRPEPNSPKKQTLADSWSESECECESSPSFEKPFRGSDCPACDFRKTVCPGEGCLYYEMFSWNGESYFTNLERYMMARMFVGDDHGALTRILPRAPQGLWGRDGVLRDFAKLYVSGIGPLSGEDVEELCRFEDFDFEEGLGEIVQEHRFARIKQQCLADMRKKREASF